MIAGLKAGTGAARRAVVDAANQLEAATLGESRSIAEFLRMVDEGQAVFYRALKTQYPDGYARLLSLKISNLFVARYHFLERHTTLVSSPIQLVVDPSNACQLRCPGCVHTDNADYQEKAGFQWPSGNLSLADFERFIEPHAAFALGIVFYNYGEPFLNKKTPAMIRRSKDFLLNASTSSNLSLPVLDADAIVESGLNSLYASIDGATQEVYQKFRRRGKLDLVFNNIEKIVHAKKKHECPVPYIKWNYLTFKHNLDQVALAENTGRRLGVNELNVITPFSVAADDPGFPVAESNKKGAIRFNPGQTDKGKLDEWASFEKIDAVIEACFSETWLERGDRLKALHQPSNRSASGTCGWLYKSITTDASGRIMPCCIAPGIGKNLVYGSLEEAATEGSFNLVDTRQSRLSFADRKRFEHESEDASAESVPHCASCDADPEMSYTLQNAFWDLCYYDRRRIFDREIFRRLTDW